MNNLKIGTRMGAAFATLLALLMLVLALGLASMRSIDRHLDNIVHNNNAKVSAVDTMQNAIRDILASTVVVVLLDNEKDMAEEMKRITAAKARCCRSCMMCSTRSAASMPRARR